MSTAEFEPLTPATEQPQILVLYRSAAGFGPFSEYRLQKRGKFWLK
jgi:hypothetical protein